MSHELTVRANGAVEFAYLASDGTPWHGLGQALQDGTSIDGWREAAKPRLIIDLLRSGVNGDVVLPERVVLPRLADFVNGIIDLMEYDLGGAVVVNEG